MLMFATRMASSHFCDRVGNVVPQTTDAAPT